MRQAKRMNDLKLQRSAMAPDTIEVDRADSALLIVGWAGYCPPSAFLAMGSAHWDRPSRAYARRSVDRHKATR